MPKGSNPLAVRRTGAEVEEMGFAEVDFEGAFVGDGMPLRPNRDIKPGEVVFFLRVVGLINNTGGEESFGGGTFFKKSARDSSSMALGRDEGAGVYSSSSSDRSIA